jgi:hypothetical protein
MPTKREQQKQYIQRYIITTEVLSLTKVQTVIAVSVICKVRKGVGGPRYAAAGTHCAGGWGDVGASLDGCGKSHPYRGSNPEPFKP